MTQKDTGIWNCLRHSQCWSDWSIFDWQELGSVYTQRLKLYINISIYLGHDKGSSNGGVSLYSEYNPWDKLKRDLDIKYEED